MFSSKFKADERWPRIVTLRALHVCSSGISLGQNLFLGRAHASANQVTRVYRLTAQQAQVHVERGARNTLSCRDLQLCGNHGNCSWIFLQVELADLFKPHSCNFVAFGPTRAECQQTEFMDWEASGKCWWCVWCQNIVLQLTKLTWHKYLSLLGHNITEGSLTYDLNLLWLKG